MKQNFYDCLSEIARGHNWVGSAMLLAYECFSQLPVSLQSDPHIADMANMNTDNFEYNTLLLILFPRSNVCTRN